MLRRLIQNPSEQKIFLRIWQLLFEEGAKRGLFQCDYRTNETVTGGTFLFASFGFITVYRNDVQWQRTQK